MVNFSAKFKREHTERGRWFWYQSKRVCDFLLVINSNYGPILHRFRDTATYWLQMPIFSTPLSFGAEWWWWWWCHIWCHHVRWCCRRLVTYWTFSTDSRSSVDSSVCSKQSTSLRRFRLMRSLRSLHRPTRLVNVLTFTVHPSLIPAASLTLSSSSSSSLSLCFCWRSVCSSSQRHLGASRIKTISKWTYSSCFLDNNSAQYDVHGSWLYSV